mgnify:CR=1 FL=1
MLAGRIPLLEHEVRVRTRPVSLHRHLDVRRRQAAPVYCVQCVQRRTIAACASVHAGVSPCVATSSTRSCFPYQQLDIIVLVDIVSTMTVLRLMISSGERNACTAGDHAVGFLGVDALNGPLLISNYN